MPDYTHKELYRGYTICIYQDTDPLNPVEDYDQFGTMACFHRNYVLGHKHDHRNPDELWAYLYEDMPCIKPNWYDDGGWDAATEAQIEMIKAKVNKGYVILPLYLYDHSGITMSTTPFSCRWDSGQVGIVYAKKDKVIKEFSNNPKGMLGSKIRQRAERLMKAEVETYDHYLTGQCYGYDIYKGDLTDDNIDRDDEIDFDSYEAEESCGGYLGDYDTSGIQTEAKSVVDHLVGFATAKQAYSINPEDAQAILAST